MSSHCNGAWAHAVAMGSLMPPGLLPPVLLPLFCGGPLLLLLLLPPRLPAAAPSSLPSALLLFLLLPPLRLFHLIRAWTPLPLHMISNCASWLWANIAITGINADVPAVRLGRWAPSSAGFLRLLLSSTIILLLQPWLRPAFSWCRAFEPHRPCQGAFLPAALGPRIFKCFICTSVRLLENAYDSRPNQPRPPAHPTTNIPTHPLHQTMEPLTHPPGNPPTHPCAHLLTNQPTHLHAHPPTQPNPNQTNNPLNLYREIQTLIFNATETHGNHCLQIHGMQFCWETKSERSNYSTSKKF